MSDRRRYERSSLEEILPPEPDTEPDSSPGWSAWFALCLESAEATIGAGQYQRTLEAADHILGLALRSADMRVAARADELRLRCAMRLLRFEQLIEWGEAGLARIDSVRDAILASAYRGHLTVAYVAIGMPAEALRFAVRSLRDARVAGEAGAISWSLNRLGMAYESLGRWEQGLDHLRLAIDASNRTEDAEVKFAARFNLALTLVRLIQSDRHAGSQFATQIQSEARRVLEECFRLTEGHLHRRARVSSCLAMVTHAEGDLGAMLHAVEEFQDLASRMGIAGELDMADALRADWHLARGDAQLARDLVSRAARRASSSGDHPDWKTIQQVKLRVCRAAGDHAGCVEALESILAGERAEASQRLEAQGRMRMKELEVLGLIAARTEAEHLRQEAEQLKREVMAARSLALEDALTGLPNRRAVDQRLEQLVQRASREGVGFCAALIDVDKFKSVNDLYGHDAGDRLLKLLGGLLRRQLDTVAFAGRNGGEEFVVLFADHALQAAKKHCEALVASSRQATWDAVHPGLNVTLSIGLTEFCCGEDASSLMRRADEAMYTAKSSGRDRLFVQVQS